MITFFQFKTFIIDRFVSIQHLFKNFIHGFALFFIYGFRFFVTGYFRNNVKRFRSGVLLSAAGGAICSPAESYGDSLFNYYLHDYFLLLFIIVFCLGLSGLLYFLAYLVSPKILSEEKSSGYECGYEPFEDARVPFSVQFYLVSILFLIFDIEVAFLFPYGVVFSTLYLNGILIFFLFLLILALGFVFEYKKKAINW